MHSKNVIEQTLPDIVILDGAVGSGKGTQATLLADHFGYYQFGFGTELRQFVTEFSELSDHPNYAKALEIRELMRVGENVSPENLFFAAGEKITNLIESGQRIVIDSVKTMGAFEWLAEIKQKKNLSGLLVHLVLDIDTSLERLSHRYYVPGLSEIPFNSHEEALKHCNSGQVPVRREDDLNTDRIHNQFKIYNSTRAEVREILVYQGGFQYLEIDAKDTVDHVFDKIKNYFQTNIQYPIVREISQNYVHTRN